MATNFFFNNFNSSQEQLLIENLVIESIRIYGEDMYYIPRKINNYDKLLGADDQSSYEVAYPIELYIKSVDGFSGDGDFMSKFGIEIRNQVVFSIAQRRFYEDIGAVNGQIRPNEGDIIYFPLNGKVFQIKEVSKFEFFYQMGSLQTWELTCELFEYSSEKFSTGIDAIDSLQTNFSENIFDFAIYTESGIKILNEDSDYLVLENMTAGLAAVDDSTELQTESDQFIDWSKIDPFSEGNI